MHVLTEKGGGRVRLKEYQTVTDVCSLDICSVVSHCQGSS